MNKKKMLELKNEIWSRKYELSDDELEKLIEEKFIRASEYQKVIEERENRLSKLKSFD